MNYEEVKQQCMMLGRNMVCLKCTSDDMCPICLGDLYGKRVFVGSCGHTWHLSCHQRIREHEHLHCCICRRLLLTSDNKKENSDTEWPEQFVDYLWRQINTRRDGDLNWMIQPHLPPGITPDATPDDSVN